MRHPSKISITILTSASNDPPSKTHTFVSADELSKLICLSADTFCDLDPIPTSQLKLPFYFFTDIDLH
jgi:hypothetical protein